MNSGQSGRRRNYRRRRRSGHYGGETFAAVDLGTNNCRLLVARPARGGFRVVDAFSRIVRLGEGVGRTGALSEPAMERTLSALKVCAQKMERRGVGEGRARAVATEACRRAANCAQFIERVREETGIVLEIIDTEEEAKLALRGCTPLLDRSITHALLFDIGGGSTEVSWLKLPGEGEGLDNAQLLGSHSLPLGVVTLADHHPDCVSGLAFEAMTEDVRASLVRFEETHDIGPRVADGQVQMIGTSGTVTTLAGVHMNLDRYRRDKVDGCFMAFEDLRAVIERIREMDVSERAKHPCIGVERADLVLAGCAILEGICRTWPVGRLRVADRGLREGILLGLMNEGSRGRALNRAPAK